MSEHILIGLATILALGMIAQWIAWRTHLPSILALLLFGLLAGPVTGMIDPDALLGGALFPLVSLSVAVILFEGGLSLKFDELKSVGGMVRNLATSGALVTGVLSTVGAHYIIGLDWGLAALLGAILIVSGPTVIIPLLRQVRPHKKVASILKWEGIVNDPIGALIAALIFEALLSAGPKEGSGIVMFGALKALLAGGLIGAFSAFAIVTLLKRHLIPDFLQSPITLMFVAVGYVTANEIQTEAGLFAVTAMGIALANQKTISIKQITQFKENLRVLLIGGLFILLAARLPMEQLTNIPTSYWWFIAALVLIIRPLTIYVSALGQDLKFREKLFLAWMAPRGIVAAAVVSVFSIRLVEHGYVQAEVLTPIIFIVIISTVTLYGLSASPVARWLSLASPNPQGVLIAGAHSWAQEIALALHESGFSVALMDSNWQNVATARGKGLNAHRVNAVAEDAISDVSLGGVGKFIALTPNDDVNALAALHYEELFGRVHVYQLCPVKDGHKEGAQSPRHLRGRYLFEEAASFERIDELFAQGAVVKRTPITEEFNYDAFKVHNGADAIPLMAYTESGALRVFTNENAANPEAGETLISIVTERDSSQGAN
ncbi:sodium:proton antiporter [Gemmatimonas aurantiaca]|nr:sodium:proton antiporter [Gemmatimonas aurantiaca]